MSDETRRVLDLLAQGKITVDEADRLLRALNNQPPRADVPPVGDASSSKPRFIRIHVHKPGREGRDSKDVNIRVPMSILRGGIRLGTMIPGLQDRMAARLRERGMDVDLSRLDPAVLESMLGELGEINIDVSGTGEQVRITCEP